MIQRGPLRYGVGINYLCTATSYAVSNKRHSVAFSKGFSLMSLNYKVKIFEAAYFSIVISALEQAMRLKQVPLYSF